MPADRNLKFERANHAITFVRQFDARAEQVYRAHTDVDLIPKWLGGYEGWTMPECVHDNRVGGAYRYAWSHAEQQGFAITGTILDLKPGARIVHTERFDGVDMGGETVVTTHFAEADGVTTLRMCVVYDNPDALETALATGMTDGMQVSYERLDALVAA